MRTTQDPSRKRSVWRTIIQFFINVATAAMTAIGASSRHGE
ncbi:MAG: smalltalk protein [Mediterranea sp.]|nr:smalltalk protein [Mediterranea sp.]